MSDVDCVADVPEELQEAVRQYHGFEETDEGPPGEPVLDEELV